MSAISLGLPSLPIGILLWKVDVSLYLNFSLQTMEHCTYAGLRCRIRHHVGFCIRGGECWCGRWRSWWVTSTFDKCRCEGIRRLAVQE